MKKAFKRIIQAKVKAKSKAELLEKLANEINQMPEFTECRINLCSIVTPRIHGAKSEAHGEKDGFFSLSFSAYDEAAMPELIF